MPAKHQVVAITIPKEYGPTERQAIAQDVLQFIRKRTQSGRVDKNGKPFPGYSKEYIDSLDFKIAGKSKSAINLTLSGDMLAAMDLQRHEPGKIVIGFQNGTEENARADGNIRGTYGKDRGSKAKARDFLGIGRDDLQKILAAYPKPESQEQARQRLAAAESAARLAGRVRPNG